VRDRGSLPRGGPAPRPPAHNRQPWPQHAPDAPSLAARAVLQLPRALSPARAGAARSRRAPRLKGDFRHLVLVILLRIAAEQGFQTSKAAILVEPDLRRSGIEPDQLQLGIVLAALIPSRRERAPQPVDGLPVVILLQPPV